MSSSSVELKDRSSGNAGAAVNVAAPDTVEWNCGDSECNHVNLGRRTCQKCERERSAERSSSSGGLVKKKLGTEIGKAAAEKSRGLFSAEDWQCSKCANVNWARRQTCNMCNAPKFCDVEERTGYGGGYNDRGVVEYKERSESDSEYDEFGRLKKRRSTKNHHSDKDKVIEQIVKRPRKDATEEEEEDEEEEEEEDDGDGDLSKYDLWGDDEVAAFVAKSTIAKANVKSATEKTKSRSRSRSASNSSSRSSGSSSTNTSSSSSSSSSTSSSTGGSSRSGSSSASKSSGDRKSRSRTHHRHSAPLEADEENHKVKVEKRSLSKTHSQQSHSSHKSTRHTTKSRSRSTSSAKKRRRGHPSNVVERSKDRSRSHSHSRKYSNSNASSTKYKRSNSSRSPATRYRKHSRTRSRSLSAGRRRR